MHVSLWRVLADVTGLLFIGFKRSWKSGEIADYSKNKLQQKTPPTNVLAMLKKSETYRAVGFSTAPWRIMEQIL